MRQVCANILAWDEQAGFGFHGFLLSCTRKYCETDGSQGKKHPYIHPDKFLLCGAEAFLKRHRLFKRTWPEP